MNRYYIDYNAFNYLSEMRYLPLSLLLAAPQVTKANCVLKGTQGHDQINGIVFFEVSM